MMSEFAKPFKTIASIAGPLPYKEKKSKFIAWVYPVTTVEEANKYITGLRAEYSDASHVCYAYRIGISESTVRMSDDGEPSHSAGNPIMGQVEATGLYDVLVCVIRYYGGINLGVGGLKQAYREAARGAIKMATVVTRTPKSYLTLHFDYPLLDTVMRFISRNRLLITSQQMGLDCNLELEVPLEMSESIVMSLSRLGVVKVTQKTAY